MTERQLAAKYKKQLKEEFPDIFIYSPGDTFGGHKRPFDLCGCYKGRFFAVEFKMEKGILRAHQWQALLNVQKAGGLATIIRFEDNKVCRDFLREWLASPF